MSDDADGWYRIAALLPDAEAQEVRDCWEIGEQEAGLGLLVSGILTHQLPISETVRAQLSVLAEDWGEREALTPRILQCRGDDTAAAMELIEHQGGTDGGSPLGAGHDVADLVLVPWIACTRCGQALPRAHDREPWGDLSYLARHYIITSPDRGTVLRIFPADAGSRAFAALLEECADREPVA